MDIDIDLPTTFDPLDIFDATRASMVKDGKLVKHPVGVYFQSIPKDKLTELSAIPYKDAEIVGYFKVDFLHLSILDHFGSKGELRTLLRAEPDWYLLKDPGVVRKLFQLHNHFDLVQKITPSSVEDLADCIALIRPGKKYLLNAYLKDKNAVRKVLYKAPEDGRAYYKKSHAIAYALTIVVQLHLIKAKII